MDYSALTNSSSGADGLSEFIAAYLVVIYAISLAMSIFLIVCQWKLFTKAGYEGWKCLIPFYNQWCHFEMVWGSGAKMFLLLIPFVNFVIAIMDIFKTAKAYGGGGGIGALLFFFPLIGYPVLAFSSNYEYCGPN